MLVKDCPCLAELAKILACTGTPAARTPSRQAQHLLHQLRVPSKIPSVDTSAATWPALPPPFCPEEEIKTLMLSERVISEAQEFAIYSPSWITFHYLGRDHVLASVQMTHSGRPPSMRA